VAEYTRQEAGSSEGIVVVFRVVEAVLLGSVPEEEVVEAVEEEAVEEAEELVEGEETETEETAPESGVC